MIEVIPYETDRESEWNAFIANAKNGAFLFHRSYMEYHSDRFVDCSLMIYSDSRLVALVPANRDGDEVVSHGGLTFGGIISNADMTTALMLDVFAALLEQLRSRDVRRLVYKASPNCYHLLPADEDRYALFRYGARLIRRDVGFVLRPSGDVRFRKGRRYGMSKARKANIEVRETADIDAVWRLVEETLRERYAAHPTHSTEEFSLLVRRFPANIRCFGAYMGDELVAASVIFENASVAHTQYLASSAVGREVSALDLLINQLITQHFSSKAWFSFGTSMEDSGKRLNSGLADYKESFGARACIHDHYEILL